MYEKVAKTLKSAKATPEQKVNIQKEYCEFYANLLKKYNKNNNHDEVLTTWFDAQDEFVEVLGTLDIPDSMKSTLMKHLQGGTFKTFRDFEALIVSDVFTKDKKIDQEKIETLRSCFRSFLVAKMFVDDISLQTFSEQKNVIVTPQEDTTEDTWWQSWDKWLTKKLNNEQQKNTGNKKNQEKHNKQ